MTIELKDEQRLGYLRDEYLFLQNQYEDYDKRSLTIKGWVTGGAIAALAVAFHSSSPMQAPLLVIIVAVIVGVIWFLEAYWKVFQYALADRIRIIEAHFRNDPDILLKNPVPFQVYHSWYESYRWDEPIFPYERDRRPRTLSTRLWRAARHRFVCLPYVPIIALCALSLFVLAGQTGKAPEIIWGVIAVGGGISLLFFIRSFLNGIARLFKYLFTKTEFPAFEHFANNMNTNSVRLTAYIVAGIFIVLGIELLFGGLTK